MSAFWDTHRARTLHVPARLRRANTLLWLSPTYHIIVGGSGPWRWDRLSRRYRRAVELPS